MSQPARKFDPLNRLILDQDLARVAVRSVQDAFAAFFGVVPVAGVTQVGPGVVISGDISGILTMVQEKMEATFVISFSEEVIVGIMSRFYGKKLTGFSDIEIEQGVGELTNVIYASIKDSLNGQGHEFKMALPKVVVGRRHLVMSPQIRQTLIVPFSVEGGSFVIEIANHVK